MLPRDSTDAPKRQLVEVERSARRIFMEEPGKMFEHLVRDVLPLALQNERPESAHAP